jgi:hypothetical protein
MKCSVWQTLTLLTNAIKTYCFSFILGVKKINYVVTNRSRKLLFQVFLLLWQRDRGEDHPINL